MKKLLLSEFDPKPQCVVEQHRIIKPKYPIIDVHTHMGNLVPGPGYADMYDTKVYIEKLKAKNVQHIINLDGEWGTNYDDMIHKIGDASNFITTFVWIDVTKIDDENFDQWVIQHLENSYALGARGIKMWKVISLNQKDQSGHYIRTDDARLDVVYETAARLKMPILIHIADPCAFFEPLDCHNERYEEMVEHPDWCFGKPDQFTFQELMDMQDHMIESHPNTTFIVAHFGSYAENLDHVAKRLNRYSNMFIDIAARVAELGRVPYKARKFFIEYQDRILFGTDCCPLDLGQHEIYYRFLETWDEYFPYQCEGELPGQGRWRIYGIGLPDEVLEKIYNKNARKLLNYQ